MKGQNKLRDLTGQTFGRLTVIERISNHPSNNKTRWTCECSCGSSTAVFSADLISGNTKSCGCLHKEGLLKRSITHGLRGHPLISVWKQLKNRCYCKRSDIYKLYGGKGIKVCSEWRNDFKTFCTFCMRKGWTLDIKIDRYDSNRDYAPDNIKFIEKPNHIRNLRIARLNKSKVRRIQEFSRVGIPARKLAKTFKVCERAILWIRSGEIWANL